MMERIKRQKNKSKKLVSKPTKPIWPTAVMCTVAMLCLVIGIIGYKTQLIQYMINRSLEWRIRLWEGSQEIHSGKDIRYDYYFDKLAVTMLQKDYYTKLVLKDNGPNHLFGIGSIAMNDGNHHMKVSSYTDWVGPYNLLDESSGQAGFVGGWHAKEEWFFKVPTAKTISTRLWADGQVIKGLSAGSCQVLEIEVVNDITDIEGDDKLLQETVRYTIDRSGVKIHTETRAVKHVTIEKYYGLQTQNMGWDGAIYYHLQDGKDLGYSLKIPSQGGQGGGIHGYRYTLTDNVHPFCLSAWLDSSEGLGDFSQLGEDQPCMFTIGYHVNTGDDQSKTYFNLINGHPLTLEPGQVITWSGGYQFFLAQPPETNE